MAKRPELEPKRYHVEYLDWEAGKKLAAERGSDAEQESLWDSVDQDEITVYKLFPSKDEAAKWAQDNRKLDVFNMPRIREQTLTLHNTDDRGRRVAPVLVWDKTGYWEVDGDDILEIDEAA